MAKIITTIEQSKTLIKLGLDKNTADMVTVHQEPYETSTEKFDGVHKVVFTPYKTYNNEWRHKHKHTPYFPTWSLSVLLELMPPIDNLKPMIDLEGNSIYYSGHNAPCTEGSTLMDAAFEMICWLLKNKKL